MAKREKTEQKYRAILLAALHQLSDKGFGEAKMDDIAAEAGVAKGTLYLYFPSKESLLSAIADDVADTLRKRMGEIGSRQDIPLREKLRIIAEPLFSDNGRGDLPRALRLLWLEGARRPELVQPFLDKFFIPATQQGDRGLLHELTVSKELPLMLQRYPHLLMAPIVQAVVWSGISDMRTAVDFESAFLAFLDLMLPNVDSKEVSVSIRDKDNADLADRLPQSISSGFCVKSSEK